jgi:hypothetical protein
MKGKQMTNKSKPGATKKAKAKLKIQDLKPKKDVKGGLVEGGGSTIIKAPIYKRGWDV